MGVALSKKTTQEEEEHVPAYPHDADKKRVDRAIHEALSHSHHDVLTPRRTKTPRHEDMSLSPKGTTSLDFHEEEEKLAESFLSESDLKQSLSAMINSMVILDRRHTRAAAVHPFEHQIPPSHTRRIETSLPPPDYEMEKPRDERRGSSSLPVRCPSSRRQRTTGDGGGMSSISDDDSEYLSKLYDLRTWNMYRLITESRRRRQIEYQPRIVEEKVAEVYEDVMVPQDDEEPASFTTNMIFAFDFE